MFKPYSTNILIAPASKNKIIGDTAKYYLFGEVIDVGENVSKSIEVGDTLMYTMWGLNKGEKDGQEFFFIQDNPDFILGVFKNENKA